MGGPEGVEWWIESSYYDPDTDTTWWYVCVNPPDEGDPGDDMVDCWETPWDPDCPQDPPPEPPPPCDPSYEPCGGGGGGGGGGGDNPVPPPVAITCTALTHGGSPVRGVDQVWCRVAHPEELSGWTVMYEEWRFSPPQNDWGLTEVVQPDAQPDWGGLAAIGGTVSLRLRLAQSSTDDTVTAVTTFDVTPRGESTFSTRPLAELYPVFPPYEPEDAFPYPDNPQVLGIAENDATTTWAADQVPDGPNMGYRFLTSYTLTNTPHITIPLRHFKPAEPGQVGGYYYDRAPSTMSGGLCSQAFVEHQIPGIMTAHEGVNREPGSHTGEAYSWLASNATNIRHRAEALVYDPSKEGTFSDYVRDAAAFDAARKAPDDVPGYGKFGPSGFDPNGCVVNH